MLVKSKLKPIKNIVKIIPVLTYILIAYFLKTTHGHLYVNELLGLTTLFFFLFYFFVSRVDAISISFQWIYFIFSALVLDSTELIYAENNYAATILEALADIQIIFPILYWFWLSKNKIKNCHWVLGCSTIFCCLILVLVPLASPEPSIDVYYWVNAAAQNILQGVNPYSVEYIDIYNGQYDYPLNIVYWPGLLYPATLIKTLNIDIRYSQVFSIIMSGILFAIFNRTHKHYFLLFLLMPIGFFVLEQSWVDTLMLPYAVLLLEGFKRKSALLSSIGLGYLAASRQTNIFLVVIALVYLCHRYDRRFLVKVCGYSITFFAMLMAPFLIWNFSAFIDTTVVQVLQYPPREDSLSWASYLLANYSIVLPSKVLMVITLTLSCILGFRAKTHQDFLLSVVIVYLFFLLTLKQAFCNYYYYISFYLFLFLAYSKSHYSLNDLGSQKMEIHNL